MCHAIGANASVVFVDLYSAGQFTQLVRGMCGVPTAWLNQPGNVPDVERIVAKIEKGGRKPVLLSQNTRNLTAFGPARRVFHVNTRQDQRTLVTPPYSTWKFTSNLYMTDPNLIG
jgi:hypothetical protein